MLAYDPNVAVLQPSGKRPYRTPTWERTTLQYYQSGKTAAELRDSPPISTTLTRAIGIFDGLSGNNKAGITEDNTQVWVKRATPFHNRRVDGVA